MKRLLFFMHTGSPIGGVETWLDRACSYLSQRGFDPVVGLVRGQQFNDPDRYRQFHPNLKTVEVDGSGLDREGRVQALVRCIRSQRPDAVIPMGIVDANEAVIRCKLRGMPVRLVARAQGNLEPMLADLADYRDWIDLAVCPGRLTQQVLVHWAQLPEQRVRHIPNGADRPARRRTPRRPETPLRIGYVGRLTNPDKRCLDLIDLQQQLHERSVLCRIEVVGDGPGREELQEACREGGPAVTFYGALPHQTIYEQIFPELDVLVLLSASEAFGIVLVEAMMHGVVPVSSRYVGFYAERLVQDEQTGLSFPVGDMAAAAEAFGRLADHPGLLERLSAQAEEHGSRYTWERSLSQWEDALLEVTEAPPVTG
ncbi:MAG: glycosyltransferase family 4 protein, partial [Maioricimonas sp. JB049]